MKNIITIDSIDSIYQMKLENLGEHFEYLKNLGYNIFIGVSTIDDIYLSIQLPQPTQLTDKIKVFQFNPSKQIFEYAKTYNKYTLNKLVKLDNFNLFLKHFIENLNNTSLQQRNQILRKSEDDIIFLKNAIYTNVVSVSETLIDEYNKSHYKASSDYIIQHFFINNKRTHIYFDFKTNVYQFDKDIANEYSLTDLKNAFLKYANEKIIDYEVNIDYNNDIIKHRNNTIQKLKQIYSEFFI